ncbi:MAG: mandelate racemase/muconate lactonizing enzyme family protein [Negativicutes bacterium]|nr:mandelate racemase/muconate lactonizing enzyme family protein [Negativicutes bacterium]
MKITNVEVVCLAVPLEEPVQLSFGRMTYRRSCLVHVETDAGVDGWGESFVNHPFWALEERKITIEQGVRPLVLGEDPLHINKVWEKMYGSLNTLGLQAGARGQFMQAISGVDIALWDIKGKALGLSVCELLGGKMMDSAEVYASGLGPKNPEKQVRQYADYGIKAFKLKVGFGKAFDTNNIEKTWSAMPQGGRLMLDANMAWNRKEALEMVEILKNYQIEWLEEPCSCEDVDALAVLTKKSPIPIAGGENVYCQDGFRRAFGQNIFAIAQPDLTKTGGISEMACICQMARACEKPWAPHFFGNAVGLAATLQVFAAIPGGLIVELDANPNPLRTELLSNPLEIVDGRVSIPAGPGLGVTINLDTVAKYRI